MELLINAVYYYRANILNNDANPKHKFTEGTGFHRPYENYLRTHWRCVTLTGGVSHSINVSVCRPISGDSGFLYGRTWIFQVFCLYFSFYAPRDLEENSNFWWLFIWRFILIHRISGCYPPWGENWEPRHYAATLSDLRAGVPKSSLGVIHRYVTKMLLIESFLPLMLNHYLGLECFEFWIF